MGRNVGQHDLSILKSLTTVINGFPFWVALNLLYCLVPCLFASNDHFQLCRAFLLFFTWLSAALVVDEAVQGRAVCATTRIQAAGPFNIILKICWTLPVTFQWQNWHANVARTSIDLNIADTLKRRGAPRWCLSKWAIYKCRKHIRRLFCFRRALFFWTSSGGAYCCTYQQAWGTRQSGPRTFIALSTY